MNYINIKEAAKATGKNEKTIRRFLSKDESKPFIDKMDNKIIVDVNYLFNTYPPIEIDKKKDGQSVDISGGVSKDVHLQELINKIALYEQEIKHKEELLREKDERIIDLQKAILLLESPKDQNFKGNQKKKWWQF